VAPAFRRTRIHALAYRTVLTLPIRDVIAATPRARVVRLDLDGHTFDFAAGQAVLIASHGVDGRKPYSIASSPEDARDRGCIELLIGVGADGSPGPHVTLEPGRAVDVEGPAGAFTFPERPAERSFVFVAGGTGIAPLRAMLRHAVHGELPVDHLGLLYSARTPEDFAFADEFEALARSGRLEFRQTITRETERDWSGARGRIDRATLASLVHRAETLCFICGPAAMVDEMPLLLEEVGVPRSRIRIEDW
jgi:NAD(P)H-flavin reductase